MKTLSNNTKHAIEIYHNLSKRNSGMKPILDKIRLNHREMSWLREAITKATKELGYLGHKRWDNRKLREVNGEIFTRVRSKVHYQRKNANLTELFSRTMEYWSDILVLEQQKVIKSMFYDIRDNNLITKEEDIDELTQLKNLIQGAKGSNLRVDYINKQSDEVNNKLIKLQRNLDGEDNE